MLKRRSLEALAYIAKHLTFSLLMKEVEINTNYLLPLNKLRTIEPPSRPILEMEAMLERRRNGQDEETGDEEEDKEEAEEDASNKGSESNHGYYPHLRFLNKEAYRKAFHNQQELIRCRDDIDYLTRAMKSLVNCITIRITDNNRIWGLKSLRKKIGIFPQRCLTFKSLKSTKFIR